MCLLSFKLNKKLHVDLLDKEQCQRLQDFIYRILTFTSSMLLRGCVTLGKKCFDFYMLCMSLNDIKSLHVQLVPIRRNSPAMFRYNYSNRLIALEIVIYLNMVKHLNNKISFPVGVIVLRQLLCVMQQPVSSNTMTIRDGTSRYSAVIKQFVTIFIILPKAGRFIYTSLFRDYYSNLVIKISNAFDRQYSWS